jgi:hypothetical protein
MSDAGALTMRFNGSKVQILRQPCPPPVEHAAPWAARPQAEVGLWAPSDGHEALFGTPAPYAAYRCE